MAIDMSRRWLGAAPSSPTDSSLGSLCKEVLVSGVEAEAGVFSEPGFSSPGESMAEMGVSGCGPESTCETEAERWCLGEGSIGECGTDFWGEFTGRSLRRSAARRRRGRWGSAWSWRSWARRRRLSRAAPAGRRRGRGRRRSQGRDIRSCT